MRKAPAVVPAGRYARSTNVDVARTQHELRALLEAHGATGFLISQDETEAAIRFAIDDRRVRVVVPLPSRADPAFTHTRGGRPRRKRAHERAYEQALRQHWRIVLLVLRAKLEAIAIGLSSLDLEFPASAGDSEGRTHLRLLLSRTPVALAAGMLIPLFGFTGIALPANTLERLSATFEPAGTFSYELVDTQAGTSRRPLGGGRWVEDDEAGREAVSAAVGELDAPIGDSTRSAGKLAAPSSPAAGVPVDDAGDRPGREAAPASARPDGGSEARPERGSGTHDSSDVEQTDAGPKPGNHPQQGADAGNGNDGHRATESPAPSDRPAQNPVDKGEGQGRDQGQGADQGESQEHAHNDGQGQNQGQSQGTDQNQKQDQDQTQNQGQNQGQAPAPGSDNDPQAGPNEGKGQAAPADPGDRGAGEHGTP